MSKPTPERKIRHRVKRREVVQQKRQRQTELDNKYRKEHSALTEKRIRHERQTPAGRKKRRELDRAHKKELNILSRMFRRKAI